MGRAEARADLLSKSVGRSFSCALARRTQWDTI